MGVPRGSHGFPAQTRISRKRQWRSPSRPLLFRHAPKQRRPVASSFGAVFPGAPPHESPRSRRVRGMLVPSPHPRRLSHLVALGIPVTRRPDVSMDRRRAKSRVILHAPPVTFQHLTTEFFRFPLGRVKDVRVFRLSRSQLTYRQWSSRTRFRFQAGISTTTSSQVPFGTHWQANRDCKVTPRACSTMSISSSVASLHDSNP